MRPLGDQTLWFVFGLTLGIISTLQIVAVIRADDPVFLIERFQGLIGALVAVLVAALTVVGTLMATKNEIENGRELEDRRRDERLRAARVMLPFAAQELHKYSRAVIEQISRLLFADQTPSKLRVTANEPRFISGEICPPPLPQEAFARVKEMIELAPIDVGEDLGETIFSFQADSAQFTQDSYWLREGITPGFTEDDLLSRLVDQVVLCARVERFYWYGIGRDDVPVRGKVSASEFAIAGRRVLGLMGGIMATLDEIYGRKV